MKNRLWIALFLIVIAGPTFAAKVTVDYDHKADLKSYHTFQYQESKDHPSSDPLIDQRIVESLQNMLTEGGLKKVDSSPDVFVTYHIKEEEEKSFTTTGMGYGVGGGWGRWGAGGMGTTTTTEQDWTVGTIIVDIWDASTKQTLWRGTAQQAEKSNPQKRTKQIQKAFDQMLAKWTTMRAAD